MASTETVRERRKAKPTPNNESTLLQAVQRFYKKSYAGDYIGLAVLCAAYLLIKFWKEPFHKMFTLNDLRIQHPHADPERVPVAWLFIYAAGIPVLVCATWLLTYRPDFHKAHVTLLGLAISIITTLFLTDLFKNAIGRPRPDLIARCKPELSAPMDELVTVDVCTEMDANRLQDGFRSFPSGHSSFSFAGLGWLALFFASQTQVFRPRASLFIVLLCLAPLLGAALIAISRLEDYRHDVEDVIAGSLLGFLISCFNWRRYYPSLWSKACNEPYSPPGSSGRSSPNGGFQRVRDEEEELGLDGMRERFSIGEDRDGDR